MATIISRIHISEFKGLSDVIVPELGSVNAFFGKNNSGKSTILHAIDIASLALEINDWSVFQPKLEIKDLFTDSGQFKIELTYSNAPPIEITSNSNFKPIKDPQPIDAQIFKTVFVSPTLMGSLATRRHHTRNTVIERLRARNLTDVNSLNLLSAIRYYGSRNERGFTIEKL